MVCLFWMDFAYARQVNIAPVNKFRANRGDENYLFLSIGSIGMMTELCVELVPLSG